MINFYLILYFLKRTYYLIPMNSVRNSCWVEVIIYFSQNLDYLCRSVTFYHSYRFYDGCLLILKDDAYSFYALLVSLSYPTMILLLLNCVLNYCLKRNEDFFRFYMAIHLFANSVKFNENYERVRKYFIATISNNLMI